MVVTWLLLPLCTYLAVLTTYIIMYTLRTTLIYIQFQSEM